MFLGLDKRKKIKDGNMNSGMFVYERVFRQFNVEVGGIIKFDLLNKFVLKVNLIYQRISLRLKVQVVGIVE